MIWFYLVVAILMSDGAPVPTINYPYASAEECNDAGLNFVKVVKEHPEMKQAGWYCQPIDFDKVDPVAPKKHIPGKDEA